jgi:transposase
MIMAKKAKKIKTNKGIKLEVVNPNAAGIDVSSREMQVCVPEDRDGENNRCFGTFTEDLHLISDWLKTCGITTVAMESTGVYWVQLYMRLEEDGFDVLLVNAKAIKNIGEKKTDEVDAQWIMLLHSYGLLKASFQPDNQARRIRNLSRHKDKMLKSSSREVLHMHKAMELMNIKLVHVISDILGKSGIAIIESILGGEREACQLAALADPRCKASPQTIEKSLVAKWDDDLIFLLEQSYRLYQFYQKQMQECDKKIERIGKEYLAQINSASSTFEYLLSGKKNRHKNAIAFDVEPYACALWGVNLMRVPGISEVTVFKLMGELGYNFTDKFETYKQFCRWCNVSPNNKISGGKVLSSKIPKRKNQVGIIFILNCCQDSLNTLLIFV